MFTHSAQELVACFSGMVGSALVPCRVSPSRLRLGASAGFPAPSLWSARNSIVGWMRKPAATPAATPAALPGAATLQARLPPSFPAAFGEKDVASPPVASCGQLGPEAPDAAATVLEDKASDFLKGARLAVGCAVLLSSANGGVKRWAVEFVLKGAVSVFPCAGASGACGGRG